MGGPGEFSSPSGGGCGGTGRQRPAEGFSIYRFSTQTRFSEDTEPGCLGLLLEIHRTAPPLKVKASRSIPESGGSSEGRGTRPRPGLGGWRRPGGGDSSNSTLGGGANRKRSPFPSLSCQPRGAPGSGTGRPLPIFSQPRRSPPGAASAALGRGVPGGCAPRAAPRRPPPAVSVPALLAHPPLPMAAAVPAV